MTLQDPLGFRKVAPQECPVKPFLKGGVSTGKSKIYKTALGGVLVGCFSAVCLRTFGLKPLALATICLYKCRQSMLCWNETLREDRPKLAARWCAVALGIWYILGTLYVSSRSLYFPIILCALPKLVPAAKKNPARQETQSALRDEAAARVVDLCSKNSSARLFRKVCQKSPCLFAKQARVLASVDWVESLSFAKNITHNVLAFKDFLHALESENIDGFVFRIPDRYAQNERQLAESVLRIFRALESHDPSGIDCLNNNFVHKKGWAFSFDCEPFFVTTFATFYSATHSRHCEEGTFVLFQPELSFYKKKLPRDHGLHETVKTIRDRIRENFEKHGCQYYVPASPRYPAAHHIVKPVEDVEAMFEGGAPGVVRWWESPDAKSTAHSLDRPRTRRRWWGGAQKER